MQYKFRGKRIDNKEWVVGSFVSTSTDEAFILIGVTGHIKRDDYECYMIAVDPATVGMFTGIKDKNGKEIYEGDILRGFQKDQKDKDGKHGFDTTDTVYWRNGGFKVFGKSLQDGYIKDGGILYQFMWCDPGHFATPDYYYQLDDIEITSNIHDVNPAGGQSSVDNMLHDPNVKAEGTDVAPQEPATDGQPVNTEGNNPGTGEIAEEGSTEG